MKEAMNEENFSMADRVDAMVDATQIMRIRHAMKR
jgi:hypothetical protein